MPTTLSSVTILSPVSADAYFRTDLGLLVAQPSGMCWNPFLPFIIIPEGYNALVTRCGAEIPDGDGKIVLHRDYWDAASGLYEYLPVVGGLIRWIKGRL